MLREDQQYLDDSTVFENQTLEDENSILVGFSRQSSELSSEAMSVNSDTHQN